MLFLKFFISIFICILKRFKSKDFTIKSSRENSILTVTHIIKIIRIKFFNNIINYFIIYKWAITGYSNNVIGIIFFSCFIVSV